MMEILAQATDALNYVHKNKVTHRDIKPGNILVRSREPLGPLNIALSDFGLSAKDKKDMSTTCGTYTYMAPEVLNTRDDGEDEEEVDVAKKYTNKADIWSLGLVALDLLRPKGLPDPAAYGINVKLASHLDQRYAGVVVRMRSTFAEDRKGQPCVPFAKLICDMLEWDPEHRPSAEVCAQRAAALPDGPQFSDWEDDEISLSSQNTSDGTMSSQDRQRRIL